MLKPLSEWICDECHEVIKAPSDGYVEWQETGSKMHGFRIVHHAPRSPRRLRGGDCYYRDGERGGDLSLLEVVGEHGLVVLTSWLDVGECHEHSYSGPQVRDLREWVTLFRRLHLPHYEEARLCTGELSVECGGGANEVYLYLPETLRDVIDEHESSQ
jgi:hypothetical protein